MTVFLGDITISIPARWRSPGLGTASPLTVTLETAQLPSKLLPPPARVHTGEFVFLPAAHPKLGITQMQTYCHISITFLGRFGTTLTPNKELG